MSLATATPAELEHASPPRAEAIPGTTELGTPAALVAGRDAAVRIVERIARGPNGVLAVGARVACDLRGGPVVGTYIGVDYSGRACIDAGEPVHRLASHGRLRLVDHTPDARYVDRLTVRDASPALRAHMERNLERDVWSGHSVREYLTALTEGGRSAWIIGGAVRDLVAAEARGKPLPEAVDFDVVVDAAPFENRHAIRRVAGTPWCGIVTESRVEQHGTIIVGERHRGLDVTSLKARTTTTRTRHRDASDEGKVLRNVFRGSLTQDASLRDFHCNALYYDPTTHTLVDPTGEAFAAATSRTLTFIRGEHADALQAVRYFKFRLRGFATTEATKSILRAVIARTWTFGRLVPIVHRGLPHLCGDAEALARELPELRRIAQEDGVADLVEAHLLPALAAQQMTVPTPQLGE